MPATIKPASHGANSMDSGSYVQDPLELLKRTCPEESKACRELLQSSFGPKIQSSIDASRNGFVKGAIHAYNRHYHLRIRPEDVWFAILSQLSLYINAHAEELRGLFVAHEGKRELVLEYFGTRYTVDFGLFAKEMGELIEQNVVDPELRRWMMPAFTTTTKSDIIVASILLMGSTQKYFDFTCICECSLPSVTLLGDRADWELFLTRIEKLKEYGEILRFAQAGYFTIRQKLRRLERKGHHQLLEPHSKRTRSGQWAQLLHRVDHCLLLLGQTWQIYVQSARRVSPEIGRRDLPRSRIGRRATRLYLGACQSDRQWGCIEDEDGRWICGTEVYQQPGSRIQPGYYSA